MTLTIPKPKTDFMKKSITYQAICLWNNLDNLVRWASDSGAFGSFPCIEGEGGGELTGIILIIFVCV